jgi:hypothetical protein
MVPDGILLLLLAVLVVFFLLRVTQVFTRRHRQRINRAGSKGARQQNLRPHQSDSGSAM